MRSHPEPFATPGRKAGAASEQGCDGEIREQGKPARGRYAAPAASQAWCNTSGCASAKPCQRRSPRAPAKAAQGARGPWRCCRAQTPAPALPVPSQGLGLARPPEVGGCAGSGENSWDFVMLGTAGCVRACLLGRELVSTARASGACHRGVPSSEVRSGSATHSAGASCPCGASIPGAACLALPLEQPLVSLPGQAWISLKWGFQLEVNWLQTAIWRLGIGTPSMGVLSPWAGHPTHSLCGPSGTRDVSPPWQGHVRTTCLSGLQKGPESSLVANHCLHGGHRDTVSLASSVGFSMAMAQGLLWAAGQAALGGLKQLWFGFVGLTQMGRAS